MAAGCLYRRRGPGRVVGPNAPHLGARALRPELGRDVPTDGSAWSKELPTLDHIVVPVGDDHLLAIEHLAAGAASAARIERHPGEPVAHVTLLAYSGLSRVDAVQLAERIVPATPMFTFHAHGYGFFSGDDPSGLCLHVPVVRSRPLDSLHDALRGALSTAGADIARWSEPDIWSPHITLLDRHLDAARLGLAAGWLARRHHPSWDIVADRVVLTGGWAEHDRPGHVVRMGLTTSH